MSHWKRWHFSQSDSRWQEPGQGSESQPAPEPDLASQPDAGAGYEAFEAEVARLVNDFRAENGLSALNVNAKLNAAAEGHSDAMAAGDFFDHTGADGSSVGERVSGAGYDWRSVGENIAVGQSTPQEVVDAWESSSGHRENMLGSWADMGIGYEYLANDGGSVDYNHYWTLDFALA